MADLSAVRLTVARSRVTELPRHVAQQRPPRDGAARFADRLFHDARIAEVEEERHDVREALVEGQYVGVGGHRERRAQAVEDRVRRLVRDHVVRQRREDAVPRHREAGGLVAGARK